MYLKYARENNTFKSIVWPLSGWFILIFDVTGWIHRNIVCWLNQILCIFCFVCSVFFLFLPISLLKLFIKNRLNGCCIFATFFLPFLSFVWLVLFCVLCTSTKICVSQSVYTIRISQHLEFPPTSTTYIKWWCTSQLLELYIVER